MQADWIANSLRRARSKKQGFSTLCWSCWRPWLANLRLVNTEFLCRLENAKGPTRGRVLGPEGESMLNLPLTHFFDLESLTWFPTPIGQWLILVPAIRRRQSLEAPWRGSWRRWYWHGIWRKCILAAAYMALMDSLFLVYTHSRSLFPGVKQGFEHMSFVVVICPLM